MRAKRTIISMLSRESTAPVGLPGLITTIATGWIPCRQRLRDARLEDLLVQLPVVLFVQVVPDLLPAVQRQACAVERILRDRDHHAVLRGPEQRHQHRLHALARSVGEDDVVLVGLHAVALL